ncbi:MAG: hypothetical protein KZQ64_13465 [gamma proteobacterium symbiont of Bathyaustriella thionipta]|nr:hypothetical protein [gamma proteobacterium symbiont of Bathyaustriella thionipta]MCU7951019.1 hypothetical protein [gamma proteobacterium symbiont of Bathyaustriella thionipta]MCU7954377.1 hypothetical protein [gamma proteobacterium symbiont of Bathyaustriella thionipta]MCU7957525.1 hypothetical protein [gamma proteobacterium symbiont of Bathyaustriella thionipta]MCU7966435.1 hypothetical protein [gamma proteobacterium symbiont of Bathyaustriella thionipta]
MSLIFLNQPGARERHLQRQYKNPLFKVEVREFDEQRLSGARYMDEKEEAEFAEQFHSLLAEVAELKPNEDSEKMLELKSRLDQSYEQCSGLDGQRDNEKVAITKLVSVIMNSIWKGAEGDAEAEQNLQEEELARTTHYQLLAFPLVADLLRPRSPIAQDQLVPTLLSESEGALRAAFQLFDKAHQELIHQQAKQLLETIQLDQASLAEARKRLEQMIQLLQL